MDARYLSLWRQVFEIGDKQRKWTMPFTFVFLADVHDSSHNPVIDVVVASCLDAEVIFRNSAHSSRVIYDRDPGAGPGSRAFSTESVNDQGKTS